MEKVNNLDKKKLLVVGGTGFIGTHVVKEALARGFQVSVNSNNDKSLTDRFDDVEYLSIDISHQENLFNQLKDKSFHYVINLGGYIDHANYFDGGDKVFDIHFNGTKNLVSCINKNDLISFVQIGSSDEYGNNIAPQSENLRELPISTYSFAKTAATHFLQMLNRTEDFPVIILRLFLVYGPGQDHNRFIPQVIQGCLRDKQFPVSQGEQLRDFCYVSDVVNSIFLSIDNSKVYGEVINIASGNQISIKEIIIMIQNIIGLGSPKFGKIFYRESENMSLYADISKANNLLNWTPLVTIEEGIRRTIDSFIENEF